MVSAVREKNFERHLRAKREMIKYSFTFDHISYSWYLTYQHVYFRTLKGKQRKVVADLDERGFGGSLSGLPFTSLHGELITEIFNSQTKHQAGPHAAGFSTDIIKVNEWVKQLTSMQSYDVYLPRKLNCKLILVVTNAPLLPGNCMCQV